MISDRPDTLRTIRHLTLDRPDMHTQNRVLCMKRNFHTPPHIQHTIFTAWHHPHVRLNIFCPLQSQKRSPHTTQQWDVVSVCLRGPIPEATFDHPNIEGRHKDNRPLEPHVPRTDGLPSVTMDEVREKISELFCDKLGVRVFWPGQ
jgi:hypothetical protein